jgi:glycosyltransferase involved in cell wall biosynthesis
MGVERVQVIPHPYLPSDPLLQLTRRAPIAQKRFYSIGRWEPRKGYEALLEAFILACRDDDSLLTLRAGRSRWSTDHPPYRTLTELFRKHGVSVGHSLERRIRIVEHVLPPGGIVKLHFDHNIYVSSSHGEAWCLPAFDAKLSGNRMIHVPYGGTADFDSEDDVRIAYQPGPVDPSYHWTEGAAWAEYSLADLAAALAAVRAPTGFVRPDSFAARFSLAAVGAQMAERVIHVARHSLDPQAGAYYAGLCAAARAPAG